MKSKKLLAILLSTVTLLSVSPISAFAQSSIGSTSNNVSVGYDVEQKVKTEYAELKEGTRQTEVYLTVDDSDLVVSVPTTIILSGTPNEKGEYIGEYSVKASGNLSGNKQVVIEPEDYNISLHQQGRADAEAVITQDKTQFTSVDLKNATTAIGKVTANKLYAGSWYSSANFNISIGESMPTHSVSEIAQTVMGYNANFGNNSTAILGGDNTASNCNACTYDTYVLPISELGVTVGDSVIFTNSIGYSGFLYTTIILDSDWNKIAESNWVWKNANRTIEITENMKYISFKVANEYGVNNEFNKSDIPFDEFKLYRNSVTDDNRIDYISVWNKMINYDNNLDFGYELWGHNMDWDYQDQQGKISGQSLEKNLEFFDAYDLDLKSTKDNITVCWYNATGYDNASQYTYSELKQKYPNIMTFEEMLQYIKDNNKKCFANLNTVSRNDIDLVEKYGVTNSVFWGGNENFDFTSATGNMYIFCQSSSFYNLQTYLSAKNRHNQLYINTDDYLINGKYFTDEQINELINNDINIGVSFCMEHKVKPFVDFCETHDYNTLFKIKHILIDDENALKCLKAATRYVYGM